MTNRACDSLWHGLVVILVVCGSLVLPGCKPAPIAGKTPGAASFIPGPVTQQALAGFWPCAWLQLPPGTQSQELVGTRLRQQPDWRLHEFKGSGQPQDEVWQVCISSPLAPAELQQFFESQLAARQYRMAPHGETSLAEGKVDWLYIAPNCQDLFSLQVSSSNPGATIGRLSAVKLGNVMPDLVYTTASPL